MAKVLAKLERKLDRILNGGGPKADNKPNNKPNKRGDDRKIQVKVIQQQQPVQPAAPVAEAAEPPDYQALMAANQELMQGLAEYLGSLFNRTFAPQPAVQPFAFQPWGQPTYAAPVTGWGAWGAVRGY